MKVDSRRDGMLRCVIHELLHVEFQTHIKLDEFLSVDMEEAAIMAWEVHLFRYIQTRPKLLESWERAVKRKIINDPIG